MCYFTKKVLNKRFLPNRKNRWNPPVCTDERFRYVEVECGHCFECRKKKRREWRIRNYEQLNCLLYTSYHVKKSSENWRKFGESKKSHTFVVSKKTNSINRSKWNIKNKKNYGH